MNRSESLDVWIVIQMWIDNSPNPSFYGLHWETGTWDESSQGLVVLVPVPVGLPPAGVILADDVEDVTFLERQTQLPTRQVWVIGGGVVEEGPHVHLQVQGLHSLSILHKQTM